MFNLDVTKGSLLAAGFSAVPAVFVVIIIITASLGKGWGVSWVECISFPGVYPQHKKFYPFKGEKMERQGCSKG